MCVAVTWSHSPEKIWEYAPQGPQKHASIVCFLCVASSTMESVLIVGVRDVGIVTVRSLVWFVTK